MNDIKSNVRVRFAPSPTGAGSGPDLMEIILLLEKTEVIDRIQKAINNLPIN